MPPDLTCGWVDSRSYDSLNNNCDKNISGGEILKTPRARGAGFFFGYSLLICFELSAFDEHLPLPDELIKLLM